MIAAALFVIVWKLGTAQTVAADCYPITAADLRRPQAPTFEQFRVEPVPHARPAPVDLKSHLFARRYRTVLRAGARKGPNFAGHYTVVAWGCGSSCVQFAVVDAQNGAVYFPREFQSVSGVHVNSDGFEPEADLDGQGLRYRLGSRLLIVLGALDESEDRQGATYYSFEDAALRQIDQTYVKKRRCDADLARPSNKRLHPSAAMWERGNPKRTLRPPRVSRSR